MLDKMFDRNQNILPTKNIKQTSSNMHDWKNLTARRQIQLGLMVFKALNDLVPDYLSSVFTERGTPGYVLRDSANKLNVPLPRTNFLPT